MNLPKVIEICPVVNRKAYSWKAVVPIKRHTPDGWYKVSIYERKIVSEASMQDIMQVKPAFGVHVFGGSFVPDNFDVCQRKTFSTVVKDVELLPYEINDFDLFQLAYVRKKLFFIRRDPANPNLVMAQQEIKQGNQPEKRKGMTPEQIYVLGCYAMQWAEEQREIARVSLPHRIEEALSVAGGQLIKIIETGGEFVDVVWSYMGEAFRSTVYKKSLRVFNLGQCVSSGDKKHSLASAPAIIKEAIEQGAIYRTQEIEDAN